MLFGTCLWSASCFAVPPVLAWVLSYRLTHAITRGHQRAHGPSCRTATALVAAAVTAIIVSVRCGLLTATALTACLEAWLWWPPQRSEDGEDGQDCAVRQQVDAIVAWVHAERSERPPRKNISPPRTETEDREQRLGHWYYNLKARSQKCLSRSGAPRDQKLSVSERADFARIDEALSQDRAPSVAGTSADAAPAVAAFAGRGGQVEEHIQGRSAVDRPSRRRGRPKLGSALRAAERPARSDFPAERAWQESHGSDALASSAVAVPDGMGAVTIPSKV